MRAERPDIPRDYHVGHYDPRTSGLKLTFGVCRCWNRAMEVGLMGG